MSYDYGIPRPLLQFLSSCLYGDAAAYYAELNEEGRAELKRLVKDFCLDAWYYRYLHDLLPEADRAEYQNIYQTRQLNAMMGAQELKRLFRVLASHGMRFVPIKGADLAYRLYPDAALRVFVDWDIWFHPDDCERALAVLAEDGWKVPEYYSDDHAAVRRSGAHHFSPHSRGRYAVEPHFVLPNFEGADPCEMWKNTVDYPSGDGQRILAPEMNLLMLARHAASTSYYHAQVPKLLLDAAMVMQKEKVDFANLRAMAAHWHLPYPGDLLAAFPEFFPADMMAQFGAEPKKTADFRRLFELRGSLGETKKVALLLSRFEVQGRVAGGAMKHISAHTPETIRRIYHLPKQGAWGRVAWSYVCWFWTRSRRAAAWLHRDAKLRDYARMVEYLESAR